MADSETRFSEARYDLFVRFRLVRGLHDFP